MHRTKAGGASHVTNTCPMSCHIAGCTRVGCQSRHYLKTRPTSRQRLHPMPLCRRHPDGTAPFESALIAAACTQPPGGGEGGRWHQGMGGGSGSMQTSTTPHSRACLLQLSLEDLVLTDGQAQLPLMGRRRRKNGLTKKGWVTPDHTPFITSHPLDTLPISPQFLFLYALHTRLRVLELDPC